MVALVADNVFLASAFAAHVIALIVDGTLSVTTALLRIRKSGKSRSAMIALVPRNIFLARTFAFVITSSGFRSLFVTFASFTSWVTVVISGTLVAVRKRHVAVSALVAFFASDIRFAGAFSVFIARIVN